MNFQQFHCDECGTLRTWGAGDYSPDTKKPVLWCQRCGYKPHTFSHIDGERLAPEVLWKEFDATREARGYPDRHGNVRLHPIPIPKEVIH